MAGHSLFREHPLKRYFLEELSAGRVSELWWTTEERVNSQVGVIFFSTFHASLLQFPGLTDVRPFTIFSESKRRQGKDTSFIFFLVVSQMLVRLQHTWNCEVLLLCFCATHLGQMPPTFPPSLERKIYLKCSTNWNINPKHLPGEWWGLW